MENPGAWDSLIASLNVAHRAGSPERIWAFLVDGGLVRNQPGDAATFVRLYTDESAAHQAAMEAGAIGGSLGLRISHAIRDAGLATPKADVDDPFGERAEARFADWKAR